MSSMKHKLRLIGAFAALATLALGMSCRGFFQNPTLTSLTINPTAPTVEVGFNTTLQAYGVYNDNSGGYVTSNVSWSSSDTTIATVTGNGSAQLTGVGTGTATITAASQSVTGSASATIYLTITSITIDPTSTSTTTSDDVAPFQVFAIANGTTLNITPTASLLAYQNGVQSTLVTCSYDGVEFQDCTVQSGATGSYQIVASYTGSTLTATATLTVP
jgi:hypothetical protein